MTEPPPSPPNGKVAGWLKAVQGLTLTNVLVIALLVVIAIPAYTIYRALNDEKILDRLMSTYEELGDQMSGCTVRHVQQRGGPDIWGVSTGFAFRGDDRWFINVAIAHAPSDSEVVSYCETLKLIADKMLERDGGP